MDCCVSDCSVRFRHDKLMQVGHDIAGRIDPAEGRLLFSIND
jgi:hypothetical protein